MGCGAGWERLQAVSPQASRDAQRHRLPVCDGLGWQTKAGSLCHIKLLEKPRFAGNEGR